MADEKNERRDDERLDASLSVLGDDANEPAMGRVGAAPRPAANANMEQALEKGEAKPGDGNLDETSQRAAREAIRDTTQSSDRR